MNTSFNKMYLVLSVLVITLFLNSCKEDMHRPLSLDLTVPPTVSNVRVENTRGGAIIRYSLPDDPNLMYVLAEFSTRQGTERQEKASVYSNQIVLEGFYDENDYTIELYSVSKAEVKSLPVNVTIHPKSSPVKDVFSSLNVFATFGGVMIQFENLEKQEYVLHTMYKDSLNNWVDYDRYYTTGATTENYAVRGLDSIETKFAFYLKDKWKNTTDTLYATLKPFFEEIFDKKLFKNAALSDDVYLPFYPLHPLNHIWEPGSLSYFFVDPDAYPGLGFPNWFTIDLGRKYVFGRMLFQGVNHKPNWKYALGCPRTFEIWGSNTPTTDWNEWTQLGSFTIEKPSGLPTGQLANEDIAQFTQGHSFDFAPIAESFRYVRFKTTSTFGGNPDICLLELTFWGSAVN